MPRLTVQQIAECVGGGWTGSADRTIRNVRSLAEAGPEDLSFLAHPRSLEEAEKSAAGLILVPANLDGDSERWIRVEDPYVALSRVLQTWFAAIPRPEGVSPRAEIHPTASLGHDVSIGPFVSVGAGAVLEDGVTVHAGSFIGDDCVVGRGTLIHPNVTVYHQCRIGRRCIVHSAVVIGGDGYGFATSGGEHHKIPQIGVVRIEDDVEIGAGTTIDRAALGETRIGAGTKIDNLVMIAHNVKVGKRCLIVAQAGIAGSTELGDDVVFGGQSGAAGHLKIGSGVQVAAQAAVMKSWEGPVTLAGSPARPLREQLRIEAQLRRLPELLERIRTLESRLGEGPSSPPPEEEGG